MAGTSVNRERAPKPSTVAPISFIAVSSRSMALRASFTICLFREFHSVRPGIEGDNAQTAALIGRRLGLPVELVGCTTCGLSSEIGRSSGQGLMKAWAALAMGWPLIFRSCPITQLPLLGIQPQAWECAPHG